MESLAKRIERDGALNELDAVGWVVRLAKRLEALHKHGVFHGSVSPAVIETMGASRTSPGRFSDLRTTTTTLAFHSPERVFGGDLSAADDVWAVAATLYALLTGTSPFLGVNDAETRQKIVAASPPPLAVFDVGDDELQHVIDSAFERDAVRRTLRVSALREALERWHPDANVRALEPLDEDETSTSDDDQRHADDLGATRRMEPDEDDDDDETRDDDDERTMLRPLGEMLAKVQSAPKAPPSGGGGSMANAVAAVKAAVGGAVGAPPRPGAQPQPHVSPMFAGAAGNARPAVALRPAAGAPPSARGAAGPALAAPAREVVRPMDVDDDDEENAKTVMRDFPASIAEAARAAIGAKPLPVVPPPTPSSPGVRPAAGFAPAPPSQASSQRSPMTSGILRGSGHLDVDEPSPAPGGALRPQFGATTPLPRGVIAATPLPRGAIAAPVTSDIMDLSMVDDDSSVDQATIMREVPNFAAGMAQAAFPGQRASGGPRLPTTTTAMPQIPAPTPSQPGGYASHDTSPLQPIPQLFSHGHAHEPQRQTPRPGAFPAAPGFGGGFPAPGGANPWTPGGMPTPTAPAPSPEVAAMLAVQQPQTPMYGPQGAPMYAGMGPFGAPPLGPNGQPYTQGALPPARGKGLVVAAVFALLATAALTFAVIRLFL
ncbi:MAG TPA: hypothetical protein VGM56_24215 [Byssovorax sp.]